jgi:NADH:ubiquinone oxidoreductase subunit 5 (subunit L)/multisubunit Na+/H+ antiporter MnhA subunit
MLLLVLADNYLLLYVGWEGVGLASYLLIGFWQHKPSRPRPRRRRSSSTASATSA